MPDPRTRTEWAGLLSERTSLTLHRFATDVLHRDRRTVFRWLSGDAPIPAEVRRFLERPERAPWP